MTVSFPKKLHHTIPTQSWKKNRRKNYFIWCVYFRSLCKTPKLDLIPWCRNCRMIRPKFYKICVFLQSFHSRKSGLIVMLYAVVYKLDIKVYRKVSILIQKHTADISANINTNSKNHKKYLYSTPILSVNRNLLSIFLSFFICFMHWGS